MEWTPVQDQVKSALENSFHPSRQDFQNTPQVMALVVPTLAKPQQQLPGPTTHPYLHPVLDTTVPPALSWKLRSGSSWSSGNPSSPLSFQGIGLSPSILNCHNSISSLLFSQIYSDEQLPIMSDLHSFSPSSFPTPMLPVS